MKTRIDTIIINAKVYTVNKAFDIQECFAIANGKFIAVGTKQDILEKFEAIELVDLKGKTVFPGLIDAHCHFYGFGMTLQQIDLVGTKSYQEVLERIQSFHQLKPCTFIQGRGWNQNDWKTKEFPTKDKLDELFPNIPVAVNRIDGHAMLANQKALDLASIEANTKIDGGEIIIKNGKPTGILLDNAMNLVFDIMPKATKEIETKALLDAQKVCFSYGLTSVSDAMLDQNQVELMHELQENNLLKMRIYTMILVKENSLSYYLQQGTSKTERLTINAFKVFIDGALGSKGAYLKTNYENENHQGVLVTTKESLLAIAQQIKDSNFQLNVHAIGDKANEIALSTFVDKVGITKDRRWRVEHAQIVEPIDFKYFETIFPSVQPTHATSDMYWAEKILGNERMKGAYAYKDLLAKSGKIALGTDFPIEQVNPFLTFYSAVARKDTKGFPVNGFQVENALTREETIKGMTIWAAYSNFEENTKGSIEVGKYADFVVLDRDIMTCNIDNVPKTNVLRTYSGGELVYQN